MINENNLKQTPWTWKTSNLHVFCFWRVLKICKNRCLLNELERFPVSWTAVSSLNWTLEVSSGESVEKLNPEREQQWIIRDVLQCWRDFLNFYKLRWACLDCGRGPVSHSTWTVPDKNTCSVNAPSREHSCGSASQNRRSWSYWVDPPNIYDTHYLF